MEELQITTIKNNPELEGLARTIPDVVYSTEQGEELKMTIIIPWNVHYRLKSKCPCIVFIQGSAWTKPDLNCQLPQLGALAQKGYVMATVDHRSCLEGYAAPAFLKDVKTAIRFLRANANEYGIDPERIGVWGTSSGGNTALLMGLTGDDPVYRTEEYPEYSDRVKTVVECFGPADFDDMLRYYSEVMADSDAPKDDRDILGCLLTHDEEERKRIKMLINPIGLVKTGKEYPPFLIIHGDKDELVPYQESVDMAKTLCEHGVHTEMIRVEGAEHEGTFWSQELLRMIEDYFDRTL